jgi:hypothetical protein
MPGKGKCYCGVFLIWRKSKVFAKLYRLLNQGFLTTLIIPLTLYRTEEK